MGVMVLALPTSAMEGDDSVLFLSIILQSKLLKGTRVVRVWGRVKNSGFNQLESGPRQSAALREHQLSQGRQVPEPQAPTDVVAEDDAVLPR